MAFCSFSKDTDNTYTIVENKFITKYLPEADGFAVKVYLYGLYLCKNTDSDFSIASMAEVLKTNEEDIARAFAFWQDYDLVEILSQDPFTVQYLPVKAAVGKPKKVRYEQYTDFNKELQRKMQKVGKFVSSGDYLKYMHFLEENNLQPQALLLIAEYCINKQGEAVSPSYIFNKAKKLIRGGLTTYEQVEKELSSYNAHEGDLLAVFAALSLFQRTPDENDYALYAKWTERLGFSREAIVAAAKKLKRGNVNSLDLTLDELAEKGKTDAKEIEVYLTERETLANLTFRIGRKLGVKIANPAPYIDEYVEKWYDYGFEESSLLDLALFCMKTARGDFDSMNALVQKLFGEGILSKEAVKAFLKEQNDDLKLFGKVQEICGALRKNSANLSLIKTWRDWKFNDAMILEAAKRSTASSAPLPYMNKILSDWKQAGVYALNDIPENKMTGAGMSSPQISRNFSTGFVNPAIQDINAKSDRERYYALLREKAQTRAERFLAKANGNERFKEIVAELKKMELALAKAEVFEPTKLPALQQEKAALIAERKALLGTMGIEETQLLPQFACARCSDTGFLPSGVACDCYNTAN
ncbi:MAG: DnaD domain protein [Clostridia bacterium]|nr:DnaD domain protein [Clostridia bacterium]